LVTFTGGKFVLLLKERSSSTNKSKLVCCKYERYGRDFIRENILVKNKGSTAIEAAIVLTVFISVILSVSLLMKVIYTYEIMQNAISLTANELSSYSYLYYLSGIEGIHDKFYKKVEEFIGEISFDEKYGGENTVKRTTSRFHENTDIFNIDSADANDLKHASILDVDLQNEESLDIALQDELKSLLYSVIKGTYDDSTDQLFIPIIKMCIKKYLVTDEIREPDERLKILNIAGGFNGLDFSMSEFFRDENDTISIVVRYKINMPVPVNILPQFTVIQKASVRGWLGGDEVIDQAKNRTNEDIWSLDNFTRGRKIREIFGANLPFTFPVIARYDNDTGTVMMIKSMDLTLTYYQNPSAVSKKIRLYIDELKAYKGQEVPWGKDKIVIKNSDIAKRQLTLVIPNNPINSEVEQEIEHCRLYAADNGVDLNVVKYGTKQMARDEE